MDAAFLRVCVKANPGDEAILPGLEPGTQFVERVVVEIRGSLGGENGLFVGLEDHITEVVVVDGIVGHGACASEPETALGIAHQIAVGYGRSEGVFGLSALSVVLVVGAVGNRHYIVLVCFDGQRCGEGKLLPAVGSGGYIPFIGACQQFFAAEVPEAHGVDAAFLRMGVEPNLGDAALHQRLESGAQLIDIIVAEFIRKLGGKDALFTDGRRGHGNRVDPGGIARTIGNAILGANADLIVTGGGNGEVQGFQLPCAGAVAGGGVILRRDDFLRIQIAHEHLEGIALGHHLGAEGVDGLSLQIQTLIKLRWPGMNILQVGEVGAVLSAAIVAGADGRGIVVAHGNPIDLPVLEAGVPEPGHGGIDVHVADGGGIEIVLNLLDGVVLEADILCRGGNAQVVKGIVVPDAHGGEGVVVDMYIAHFHLVLIGAGRTPQDQTETLAGGLRDVVIDLNVGAGLGIVGIPPCAASGIPVGGKDVDGIVGDGQIAAGDPDVLAVLQGNAVAVQVISHVGCGGDEVLHGDVLDQTVGTGEGHHAIGGGFDDGDVADGEVADPVQTHGAKMDGVGALLLGRHFDGTGTGDLDIRGAFAGINEGIAFVEAVTPADTGDGVVTPGGGVGDQSIPLGFDVGILVGVLLQHGTVTEVQLHVAAQDQVAAKEGLACGEGDGAAACGMHRVDGSLNGGPVIGGAVACRAVVGDHIYGCSCGFCSNGDQQQTQTQAQNRDDGKFLHNFCFLSDNVDLQPIIVLYKL